MKRIQHAPYTGYNTDRGTEAIKICSHTAKNKSAAVATQAAVGGTFNRRLGQTNRSPSPTRIFVTYIGSQHGNRSMHV